MDDYSVKRNVQTEQKAHPNLIENHEWGAKFIQNFKNGSKHTIFDLTMSETHTPGKYIFIFYFTGDNLGKMELHANPVDPNQNVETFKKEFKATYVSYFNLQKKWNYINLPKKADDSRRAYKENESPDEWDKIFGR